ncbi:uncharacterized protein LOC114931837 [Nylanderia fulva]|uniref:uncharacterized protein LOC114931837 n=1 Tax=Nylanderia fulva TaxID=613905 RepID=UPI0010FB9FE1|nr:uncharacterized protein LOC114931837 [Nylanderia fulva]
MRTSSDPSGTFSSSVHYREHRIDTMLSPSDIRPLLLTARLFGCGLYVVGEDDITMMKYGAIYSILFALLYFSFCITNFYMLWMDDVLGPRLRMLTAVRTLLSYACVLSDIVMTFLYNWKIRAALSHIRIFDRATKYKENKRSYRIRYGCWAFSFIVLSFWSIVGYITFQSSSCNNAVIHNFVIRRVEPRYSVFNGITYAVVNATLSMQLITFASLSSLLYERFRRLCEILLLPEDGKIMVVDRSSRQFRLQEVWWLHSCLTNATEMINSVYAVQLLLWISCMSFNTLTRIYTINDGGAISLPLLTVREVMLVSACVTNLLIISIVCHATANQANRVGKIAFAPSSAVLAKRSFQDCNVEAVTYFQLQQVHYYALFGIIRIDLPLLLSVNTTTSRIEVADNNGMPTTVPYNDSAMEMDMMTDLLWDFYEKFSETNYLLIILYVPVIVLAVTANILVIAVVFKYHYMRSVTNYFVVNLSVADLLVTIICMPVAVIQADSIVWRHGELMCKLSSYLQGVAVAASVFTITAMSIDRYLAIRSPMAFRRVFNRKSTVLVIVALWLVALGIFAPVLRGMTLHSPTTFFNLTLPDSSTIRGNFSHDISRLPPTFYICSEDFRPLGIRAHVFGTACFILVYAIPGFVVILAYSMMGRTLCSRKPPFDCDSVEGSASSQQSFRLVRERRRIAWILLLLAVLFALCWLPYNMLRLLIDLGVIKEGRSISDALTYCLFLGHANSALNPVVYCFMTRNFRRSVSEILRRTFHGLTRCKPRRKSAMIDDCGGCSVPVVNDGARRGLLHQRRMLPGCGCGNPVRGNRNAVLALRRTATSSSGYDTFYSRHSPHLHCYMLRSIRDAPRAQVDPPENSKRNQHPQKYDENNGLETSQPRPSTLCTTDERRPCP